MSEKMMSDEEIDALLPQGVHTCQAPRVHCWKCEKAEKQRRLCAQAKMANALKERLEAQERNKAAEDEIHARAYAARRSQQVDLQKVREIIGILTGQASMCWTPRPTGTFNPAEATEAMDEAMQKLKALLPTAGVGE